MLLETRIKKLIVEQLGLDISYEEIDDVAPLFDIDENGNGLDLDSVDALELVVGIKREFGVTIQNSNISDCYNVRSLANLITSNTDVKI
ncbi:phosphopantetheine-binding protein [Lysinibacillus capsici]|uniref:acyl carrier protein n=1 Tax=Lysinibacillus capsici TaxID=2115968 RepID=UPI002E244588|nr:phosphopantetheine-binding protein [Lysinibacillus capsici]